MDDLSKVLNTCKVGCLAGSQRVNHLMYADDLVLLSPSSKGLSELLQWCQCYGIQADIRYNCKKSVVMICNPTKDKSGHEPNFVLHDDVLPVKSKVKYLGHIISDTLTDDEDMARQRRSLYVQGNIISRRFTMCSPTVKTMLFRTYCTSIYGALVRRLPCRKWLLPLIMRLEWSWGLQDTAALVKCLRTRTLPAAQLFEEKWFIVSETDWKVLRIAYWSLY